MIRHNDLWLPHGLFVYSRFRRDVYGRGVPEEHGNNPLIPPETPLPEYPVDAAGNPDRDRFVNLSRFDIWGMQPESERGMMDRDETIVDLVADRQDALEDVNDAMETLYDAQETRGTGFFRNLWSREARDLRRTRREARGQSRQLRRTTDNLHARENQVIATAGRRLQEQQEFGIQELRHATNIDRLDRRQVRLTQRVTALRARAAASGRLRDQIRADAVQSIIDNDIVPQINAAQNQLTDIRAGWVVNNHNRNEPEIRNDLDALRAMTGRERPGERAFIDTTLEQMRQAGLIREVAPINLNNWVSQNTYLQSSTRFLQEEIRRTTDYRQKTLLRTLLNILNERKDLPPRMEQELNIGAVGARRSALVGYLARIYDVELDELDQTIPNEADLFIRLMQEILNARRVNHSVKEQSYMVSYNNIGTRLGIFGGGARQPITPAQQNLINSLLPQI